MRRVALLIILVFIGAFLIVKPLYFTTAGRTPLPVELSAPAGDRPTHIDPAGETVLPNGRLITPAGVQVVVEPHPYGMALSPDGKMLVTANVGTWPYSLSIIRSLDAKRPTFRRFLRSTRPRIPKSSPPASTWGSRLPAKPDRVRLRRRYRQDRCVRPAVRQQSQVIRLDGEFNGRAIATVFPGRWRFP